MKTTLLSSGLLGLGLNSLYFVIYHGLIKGTEAYIKPSKEENLGIANVNYEEEKTIDDDIDTSVL